MRKSYDNGYAYDGGYADPNAYGPNDYGYRARQWHRLFL